MQLVRGRRNRWKRVKILHKQRLHLGSDPPDVLDVLKVSHPYRTIHDAAHDFLERVDPRFVVASLDRNYAHLIEIQCEFDVAWMLT